MKWFDAHCHIDHLPEGVSAEDVLQRAVAAGVDRIVVPGVTGLPGLVSGYPDGLQVLRAWGVHPGFITETTVVTEIAEIEQGSCPWQGLDAHPVAIGECGLDHRLNVDIERQTRVFCWQLLLAQRYNLPVIIHLVGHAQLALDMLRLYQGKAGFVMHSYSGSAEMAAAFVAAGGSISLSASCLKNPEKLKKMLAAVPLSSLMLETDAPDMPLLDWPGTCNEPAALPLIGAAIAEISGMRVEKLAEVVYTNALRFFTPTERNQHG